MFRDRDDAGQQLAEVLAGRALRDPLVLAVPRGGVVVGAAVARRLGADLDVLLARKLPAPGAPEVAVGAVAETGQVYLSHSEIGERFGVTAEYLAEQRKVQTAELARRRRLFRAARAPAPVAGRSVIVTDDGIATGATLIAALQAVRTYGPRELIVAVPVAAPDSLEVVRRWCDDAVCLLVPERLHAVGEFYDDFTQVEDAEVLRLLREFAPEPASPPR